jgi:REP-associated tyrosine transposase
MNRGVNRHAVFFSDRDRLDFGRLLDDIHRRFGAETLAYCLMTNHYHVLLRAPDDALSLAMQHLGTTYTTRTNLRTGRDGPLFRGRFHSIPVETDTYLSWAARYIHRNPLDIAGVSEPCAYRWSSYRTYVGLRAAPAFLATDLVLGLFDNDRRALAEFTECENADVFGNEPQVTDLLQLIEFEIRRDDLVHAEQRAAGAWLTRSLLVLLSNRAQGHPAAQAIDDHLDYPSEIARRKAVGRARSRLTHDPALRRILDALVTRLDLARAA